MKGNVSFMQADTVSQIVDHMDKVDDGTFVFCNENDRFYVKMHGDLIGITPKKREIMHLTCKCCGASLNSSALRGSIVKCEFCGNAYDIDVWNNDVI